jgi:hypothetical protein
MLNRSAAVRQGTPVASKDIINMRQKGSSLYDAPDPYEAGRKAKEEAAEDETDAASTDQDT